MTFDSSFGEQRYAWETLSGVTEAARAYLLYTSPRRLFVVPKRAFDADDSAEVAELLAAVRPPRERGRRRRTLAVWAAVCAAFLVLFRRLEG